MLHIPCKLSQFLERNFGHFFKLFKQCRVLRFLNQGFSPSETTSSCGSQAYFLQLFKMFLLYSVRLFSLKILLLTLLDSILVKNANYAIYYFFQKFVSASRYPNGGKFLRQKSTFKKFLQLEFFHFFCQNEVETLEFYVFTRVRIFPENIDSKFSALLLDYFLVQGQ